MLSGTSSAPEPSSATVTMPGLEALRAPRGAAALGLHHLAAQDLFEAAEARAGLP